MAQEHCPSPAEIYERYLGPAIAEPWAHVLLEYAAPQRGQRALDVACGTGVVARQIAPLVGAEGRIVALDINPEMLDVARALPAPNGAMIEWREGDAVSLPLPLGAFDLVLCQQGLQFFSDRDASVREMRRVLAAPGRVVLSVWQALRRHVVYEALFDAASRHLGTTISDVSLPFSLPESDELYAILYRAGYQRIEIVSRSLEVQIPLPERFVELTVAGAATSVPAFAELDADKRSAFMETVVDEVEPVLRRYRNEGLLTFPMFTHIAVAYA